MNHTATTDFQLCREDDEHPLLTEIEEYEAWLDSLPNNTSVDGNVAARPDNCEEMFNQDKDQALYKQLEELDAEFFARKQDILRSYAEYKSLQETA